MISAATAGRQLGVSGLLALRPVPVTGRPRYVVAIGRDGDVPLRGGDIRRALGLRSGWIRVGLLFLSRPAGAVASGTPVTLSGRAEQVKGVTLEQRAPGGAWRAGSALTIAPTRRFGQSIRPRRPGTGGGRHREGRASGSSSAMIRRLVFLR